MTIDMGWDDNTELHEAVLGAIGAASVCWNVKGEFMADRAEEIADTLVEFINKRFMPVPNYDGEQGEHPGDRDLL